jgi:hypothetical protein
MNNTCSGLNIVLNFKKTKTCFYTDIIDQSFGKFSDISFKHLLIARINYHKPG